MDVEKLKFQKSWKIHLYESAQLGMLSSAA